MAVFTEAKHTVCAEHWDNTDRGCSRCPIRKVCISGHPMTEAGLNEHRARVNQAAAQVLRNREPSEYVSAKAEIEAKARERI